MAKITPLMVKELRQKTDLPMMECKQALTECEGSIEQAMEWLRRKHKGKLEERSGRLTGEGRIAIYIDGAKKVGAIIELQCETASVGKNEMFMNLAELIARTVACGSEPNPDPDTIKNSPEIERTFTDTFGRLRENMNLCRCRRVEGAHLSSYVHHDGKSGVLLALDAVPQSDKEIGGDLCMHSLFTMPLAIDRASVPAADVEKVRKDAIEMARDDGKNEEIVAKVAEGRVNAFYGVKVLMEQIHVKTDDYGKSKICDILKQAGVGAVSDLVIMKVGG